MGEETALQIANCKMKIANRRLQIIEETKPLARHFAIFILQFSFCNFHFAIFILQFAIVSLSALLPRRLDHPFKNDKYFSGKLEGRPSALINT